MSITVQELLNFLETVEDKDQLVFMMNGAPPVKLYEIAGPVKCAYEGDTGPFCRSTPKGGLRKLSEGAEDYGFTEEDVLDGKPCIGLWLA